MARYADFSNVDDIQVLSVGLRDGKVIAELPDLQISKMSYHMEEETTSDAKLPWDNIPMNWEAATEPFATAILVVQYPVVIWGGIIVKRQRDSGSASITLNLATIEHYLDNVYITDNTFSGVPQTDLMKNIITTALAGHNINLGISAEESSVLRDRTYTADQDKTVLDAIQELSNVIDGPEFYSAWTSNDDGTYTPVVMISDTIGSTMPVTDFTAAVMAKFTVLEDYSSGYGANKIMATSTANGDVRPESPWEIAKDENRPVIEYKYSPGSSITDPNTLDDYAKAKLFSIKNGTTTISFALDFLSAPKVGLDWDMGDVVAVDVSEAHDQFPDIDRVNARIIGYDIDFSGSWTLTPILQGATS